MVKDLIAAIMTARTEFKRGASVAVAGAAGKRPATSGAALDPLQIRAAEIVREWWQRRTR